MKHPLPTLRHTLGQGLLLRLGLLWSLWILFSSFRVLAQPVVLQVQLYQPENAITNAEQVVFLVEFNEEVKGVEIVDFGLALSGSVTGVIHQVEADPASNTAAPDDTYSKYMVTVRNINGNGELGLTFSGTVQDDSGNDRPGNIANNEKYTIDNEAPVIVCPQDIVVSLLSGCETNVQIPDPVSVTDNVSAEGDIQVELSPLLGLFPIGITLLTYTATDEAGNQSSCQFNVEVTLQGMRLEGPSNVSSCEGEVVEFHVQVVGGGQPLTYQWKKDGVDLTDAGKISGTTSDKLVIDGVAPEDVGEYSVLVKDACGNEESSNANLEVLPAITFSQQPVEQSACEGENVQLSAELSRTGSYDLVWFKDGIALTNSGKFTGVNTTNLQIANISPAEQGEYTLQVTNECNKLLVSEKALVIVHPLPTAALASSGNVCEGAQANVTVDLTGEAPFELEYQLNGENPVTETVNGTRFEKVFDQIGEYTFTLLKVTSQPTNCAIQPNEQVRFSLFNKPSAVLSTVAGKNEYCEGETAQVQVDIQGDAPFDFTLQYIDELGGVQEITETNYTQNTYVYQVTKAGNHSVSLLDLKNSQTTCEASELGDTQNITIHALPSGQLSGGGTICEGGIAELVVDLQGTAPFEYTYTIDGVPSTKMTNSSQDILRVQDPGTYKLMRVKDRSGCENTNISGEVSVETVPLPKGVIRLPNNKNEIAICEGESIDLAIDLEGTAPFDFTYSVNGALQEVNNWQSNTYTFTTSEAGAYRLESLRDHLSLNAGNGCQGVNLGEEVSITLSPLPSVSLTALKPSVCTGETAEVQFDFAGAGAVDFTYTVGNASFVVQAHPTNQPFIVSVTEVGTHTIRLTQLSYSSSGCQALDLGESEEVNVYALPTATASLGGNQQVCFGEKALVQFSFAGVGPFDFTYKDEEGNQQSVTNHPAGQVYSVEATAVGVHKYAIIQLTDKGSGCVGLDLGEEAEVEVLALPTASFSGDITICEGSDGELEVLLTGAAPWQIEYSDGNSNFTVSSFTEQKIIKVTKAGAYELISVKDANCEGELQNRFAQVTENPLPTATIRGGGNVCEAGSQSTVPVFIDLTAGTAPWSVVYTDGNGNTFTVDNLNSPEYSFETSIPGSYTIVSVSDATTCTGKGSGVAQVLAQDVEPPTLINCPQDIAITTNTDACGAVISIPAPRFGVDYNDNCSAIMTHNSPYGTDAMDASGEYPVGVTDITWQVTDGVNPPVTCTQTITVSDNQRPVMLQCLENIEAEVDDGTCIATLTLPVPELGIHFTDNCTDGLNISHNSPYAVHPTDASGQYPAGTTQITWTVEDASGNTTQCVQTIEINYEPVAVIRHPENVEVCESSEAMYTVSVAGTGPFAYQWKKDGNPMSNSSRVSGVNSDTLWVRGITLTDAALYTVEVTDICGNTVESQEAELNINALPTAKPVLGVGAALDVCLGEGIISMVLTGAGPDESFKIFKDGALTEEVPYTHDPLNNRYSIDPDILGLGNGSFHIVVYNTITQCIGSQVLEGNILNYSVNLPTEGGEFEQGNFLQFCGDNTGGSLTLINSNGSVKQWESSTDNFQTFTNLFNTGSVTYNFGPVTQTTSYRVKVQSGNCEAKYSDIITIEVSPVTQGGTLGADRDVCPGTTETLTLENYEGAILRWESSTDGFASDITFIDKQSTTLEVPPLTQKISYRALVQSGICNPEFSDPVTLALQDLNVGGTLGNDFIICQGENATLELRGHTGEILRWEASTDNFVNDIRDVGNANTEKYEIVNHTVTTYYRVLVMAPAGCDVYSATVKAGVYELPTAKFVGGMTACTDGATPVSLDVELTGTGPWQFSYTNGKNTQSVVANASPYSITTITPGTYEILDVKDQHCEGIELGEPVSLTLNPLPTAGITIDGQKEITTCYNETVRVEITLTGQAPWELSYFDGELEQTLTVNTNTFFFNPTQAGTFRVTALKDANGCNALELGGSVKLNHLPASDARFQVIGDSRICVDGSSPTQLQLNLSGVAPWEVTYTDGTQENTLKTSQKNTVFEVNTPGEYKVIRLVDGNGCIITQFEEEPVSIEQLPLPAFTAGNDRFICFANNGTFQLEGTIPTGYSGNWTMEVVEGGNGLTIQQPQNPTSEVSGLSEGTYVFTWSITNGICSASDEVLIDVVPEPSEAVAHILTEEGPVKEMDLRGEVMIQVEAEIPENGKGYWTADQSGVVFDNPEAPSTMVTLVNGENTLYWTVALDGGSCESSVDVLKIYVTDLVPVNVFTPNGDGTNDTFVIMGLLNPRYAQNELVVYNRWGSEVYRSSGYQNDWNGRNTNGKIMESDTYFYVLQLPGGRKFKGTVLLKKD
ncbi:immunoglobulin domain-containing protein [Rapidithrix thailandica]|uniref:Immunoglobulin domain-containing protein n=1 Tax=Rapidithrix thailandica TaxID=413964 RepID=A0AAW9RNJ0_9BACT